MLALDLKRRNAHEYTGEAYLLAGNIPKEEKHLSVDQPNKKWDFFKELIRPLKLGVTICPPRTPLLSPPVPTFGDEIHFGPDGIDFDSALRDLEDQLILKALPFTDRNKKETARLLHLNRTTLLRKSGRRGSISIKSVWSQLFDRGRGHF